VIDYFGHFYEFIQDNGVVTIEPEYASETVRRFFDQRGRTARSCERPNLPPEFVIIQRINLGLFALFGELHSTGKLAPLVRGESGRSSPARRHSDGRGARRPPRPRARVDGRRRGSPPEHFETGALPGSETGPHATLASMPADADAPDDETTLPSWIARTRPSSGMASRKMSDAALLGRHAAPRSSITERTVRFDDAPHAVGIRHLERLSLHRARLTRPVVVSLLDGCTRGRPNRIGVPSPRTTGTARVEHSVPNPPAAIEIAPIVSPDKRRERQIGGAFPRPRDWSNAGNAIFNAVERRIRAKKCGRSTGTGGRVLRHECDVAVVALPSMVEWPRPCRAASATVVESAIRGEGHHPERR